MNTIGNSQTAGPILKSLFKKKNSLKKNFKAQNINSTFTIAIKRKNTSKGKNKIPNGIKKQPISKTKGILSNYLKSLGNYNINNRKNNGSPQHKDIKLIKPFLSIPIYPSFKISKKNNKSKKSFLDNRYKNSSFTQKDLRSKVANGHCISFRDNLAKNEFSFVKKSISSYSTEPNQSNKENKSHILNYDSNNNFNSSCSTYSSNIYMDKLEKEFGVYLLHKKLGELNQKNLSLKVKLNSIEENNRKKEATIMSEHGQKASIIYSLINMFNNNNSLFDNKEGLITFKKLLFTLMDIKLEYENSYLADEFISSLQKLFDLNEGKKNSKSNDNNECISLLNKINKLINEEEELKEEMNDIKIKKISDEKYFNYCNKLFHKLNITNLNDLYRFLHMTKANNDKEIKEITKIKDVILKNNNNTFFNSHSFRYNYPQIQSNIKQKLKRNKLVKNEILRGNSLKTFTERQKDNSSHFINFIPTKKRIYYIKEDQSYFSQKELLHSCCFDEKRNYNRKIFALYNQSGLYDNSCSGNNFYKDNSDLNNCSKGTFNCNHNYFHKISCIYNGGGTDNYSERGKIIKWKGKEKLDKKCFNLKLKTLKNNSVLYNDNFENSK